MQCEQWMVNHFAQLAHSSKFQSAKRRHCVQLRSSDGSVRHAHRISYKCQTVYESNENALVAAVGAAAAACICQLLFDMSHHRVFLLLNEETHSLGNYTRTKAIHNLHTIFIQNNRRLSRCYAVSPFIFTALHLQCGCSFDQNAFEFVLFFFQRLNIIFGVYLMR